MCNCMLYIALNYFKLVQSTNLRVPFKICLKNIFKSIPKIQKKIQVENPKKNTSWKTKKKYKLKKPKKNQDEKTFFEVKNEPPVLFRTSLTTSRNRFKALSKQTFLSHFDNFSKIHLVSTKSFLFRILHFSNKNSVPILLFERKDERLTSSNFPGRAAAGAT